MPKTTNPRQVKLNLYRLEPIAAMSGRDEWAASSINETCFVWAMGAHEARAMVEVETRTRQSESKTKLPFFSPWSSSSFTSCVEIAPDEDARQYPAGLVFTQRGPVREASRAPDRRAS